MAAVLDILWQNVAATAAAMHHPVLGAHGWSEDDDGMRDASEDELLDWVSDIEYRVGYAVGDWRAAMLTFIAYRDDDGAGLDSATVAGSLVEAYEIVQGDAEAAAAVRDRVESWRDMESAIYARDPSGANRETLDAWADALDVVGGDA